MEDGEHDPEEPIEPTEPFVPFSETPEEAEVRYLEELAKAELVIALELPKSCQIQGQECNLPNPTFRKAISHLFGRNKLCTRSIPDHVWVQACRKHYQRMRYRNVTHYASRQCEIVRQTMIQIQAWSNLNDRAGKPGHLDGWKLDVRKREQNRLKKSKKRARDAEDDDQQHSLPLRHESLGSDDDEFSNGMPDHTPTAVPEWLLVKCDPEVNYTTRQILEVLNEIQEGIERYGYDNQQIAKNASHVRHPKSLEKIPDIEMLPRISTEGPETPTPKPKAVTRKTTGG
ncbi:hypothetical protein B0T26DRAFT_637695, partial [Lasiosphaeria miniovina]